MVTMRLLSRVFLAFLLIIDFIVGFRLWWYGWPKVLEPIGEGPTASLSVERVPFSGLDWAMLAAAVAIHIAVFYFVWRTWHSTSTSL